MEQDEAQIGSVVDRPIHWQSHGLMCPSLQLID
jgi:hypothetical protein